MTSEIRSPPSEDMRLGVGIDRANMIGSGGGAALKVRFLAPFSITMELPNSQSTSARRASFHMLGTLDLWSNRNKS
jgi:hypothetical protein